MKTSEYEKNRPTNGVCTIVAWQEPAGEKDIQEEVSGRSDALIGNARRNFAHQLLQ
jgi:hypothetical protein